MFTIATDMRQSHRKSALKPLLREPPPQRVADWKSIGMFAGGITLGIVLGAGAALLLAPASGSETRQRITQRFRGAEEADTAWDDLAEELERAEEELAEAEEKARGR